MGSKAPELDASGIALARWCITSIKHDCWFALIHMVRAGSRWFARRSIGANCAGCVRSNAKLTVATCVYKQARSLISGSQSVRQLNAHELVPRNTTGGGRDY